MSEDRQDQLLPRPLYYQRLARSLLSGLGLIAFSLLVGMLGYHYLENLSWLDAYLNAAMILAGMGPVAPVTTTAGKLFAGTYAIYCGIALLTTAGLILTPVVHRSLHKFHLEWDRDN